ncbi:Mis6-domain-containing protein [Xylariomycetidae sp. FL0641]|nr:Mis6-domain-containing protein [Xylariomycetidae sp. FL0641]
MSEAGDDRLVGSELHETLLSVLQAAKVPAKKRGSNVKPTVETLTSLSYDQGLLPPDLAQLIDMITAPNFLDQASLASIVKNLYPATSVDGDVIVKVVGCFGHGKLKSSLTIQALLLKWLVMIHHLLKDQGTLSRAYSVLFNLLDTAAIRAPLCHLLALITRRRHVRPYRIQALLSLSRQTGGDPALTGLLRVFKDYYPEIIVGEATRGKASAFKHPDPQWRERVDEIQRAHAQRATARSERPLEAFRVARHRFNGIKKHPIPEVHTSHATEDSITLEEIENVDSFVRRLEKIELPNQLIAVLSDPLFQKLLLLRPQGEAHQRASNWLSSYAQDLMSGDSDVQPVDILEVLKTYASAMRTVPPVFLSFFNEYFKTWNGHDGRDLVLEILSYCPMRTYQELSVRVLRPLETKVLDGAARSQSQLLRFYTQLLRNWAVHLGSLEEPPEHTSSTITDLVNHVNGLCLTVLQTEPTISTHCDILDFYDEVVSLTSDPQLREHTRLVIPLSPLVYILQFSSSSSTVSRLCTILARYKEGFQKAMATSRSRYSPEYVNEFNGFLMDICNCLWRSRAFNTSDPNAHGCLLSRPLVNDLSSYVESLKMGASLNSLFSLSYSPLFGSFAIAYLRELEDLELERGSQGLDTRHAGPVTRASIQALANQGGIKLSWDEYRLGVLENLESNGMTGVKLLMNNTMTNLMKRKSSQ